ncbi:MAG: sarcosine oxidase subunit gamma [Sulfitobacter sp.]
MHDLTPITALGGTSPRVDRHSSVTCTEVPNVALASFAARLGHEKQAAAVLKTALGSTPPAIGKMIEDKLTAFWTGPDQWMLEAPYDSHETLAMDIAQQASGVASVTEQSDAWTRFDLTGEGVLAVMELLSALHTTDMATGDALRGSIHHLGCFVLRRDTDHFSLYGPRASAGTLHHAVVTAMKSAL